MSSQPTAPAGPNPAAPPPKPPPSASPPPGATGATAAAPTPAPASAPAGGPDASQQRGALIGVAVVALLILAVIVLAGYYLVSNPAQASVWRDVFIIFMALEAMFIGVALIILMIQLAVLTNLLKNEIKPILEATQETVNTVRGTTLFVSENLTEPIMKLNSYVAGLAKVVETLSSLGGLFRRP